MLNNFVKKKDNFFYFNQQKLSHLVNSNHGIRALDPCDSKELVEQWLVLVSKWHRSKKEHDMEYGLSRPMRHSLS